MESQNSFKFQGIVTKIIKKDNMHIKALVWPIQRCSNSRRIHETVRISCRSMHNVDVGSSVAVDPTDGVVIIPDIREVEVLAHLGKQKLIVHTYLDLRQLLDPRSVDSWMLIKSLDMGIVAVFEPIYRAHIENSCTELKLGVETFDECAPLPSLYGYVYWKATSSSRVIPIYHYEESTNSPFSFVDCGTLYGILDGIVIMHSAYGFLIWNSIIGCVGVTLDSTNVQHFPLGQWVDFTARRVSLVDDVFVFSYCYEAYEWKERDGGPKYKTIVDHVNEKVFLECNGIATTDFVNEKCVNAGELGVIMRGVKENIPPNVRGEQCIQVCFSKNGSKPELEIVKATTPSPWIDAVVVISNSETTIVSTAESFLITPPHVIGFCGELKFGQHLMVRTSTNSTDNPRVLEYVICGVFPNIFTECGHVKVKCRVTYTNNTKYTSDMGPINVYCADQFSVILDPQHIIRNPIPKKEYEVIIACTAQENSHIWTVEELNVDSNGEFTGVSRFQSTMQTRSHTTSKSFDGFTLHDVSDKKASSGMDCSLLCESDAKSNGSKYWRTDHSSIKQNLTPVDTSMPVNLKTLPSNCDKSQCSFGQRFRAKWEKYSYEDDYNHINRKWRNLRLKDIKDEYQTRSSWESSRSGCMDECQISLTPSISSSYGLLSVNREHRSFYTDPNQRHVYEKVQNSWVVKEELARVLVIEGYKEVRGRHTSTHVKFWIQSSDFHQKFLFVPFKSKQSFPENLAIGQWYTIDLQQLRHKKFHHSLRIKFGSQFRIPLDYPIIPNPKDVSVTTIGTHYVMQLRIKLTRRHKVCLIGGYEILMADCFGGVLYICADEVLDPMPEDISEFTYKAMVEPLSQQFFDKETNSETKKKCEEKEQEPLDWNEEIASAIRKCSDMNKAYIERRKIRSKENIEMKLALKAYEDEQFAVTVPKKVRLARLSACLALLRLNYAEIGRVVPEGSADKICDAEACLSASGKTKGERIREISIFLYSLLHEERHANHIRKVSEALYDTLVKTVLLNENYIKGAKCVDTERLKML